MSAVLMGRRSWNGERDDEGYRTFNIKWQIRTDLDDGPYTVMNCSSLPSPGTFWSYGGDNDPWSFCYPSMRISILQEKEGENARYWMVEQKFSNKPLKRCMDSHIEDPLSEPQKISGSFTKSTREISYDKNGDPILNSAFERLHGSQLEFDTNNPNVKIEQNVAALELSLFSSMIDTVNDDVLWGLPARCVKLSNVSWSRQLYGSCYYYYTRGLEFDCLYNTFDRYLLDEGTKVLNGAWEASTGNYRLIQINGSNPDPENPSHFIRYKDRLGENSPVILNGAGLPAESYVVRGTGSGSGYDGGPGSVFVQYYQESNFLLLGIPTSL